MTDQERQPASDPKTGNAGTATATETKAGTDESSSGPAAAADPTKASEEQGAYGAASNLAPESEDSSRPASASRP